MTDLPRQRTVATNTTRPVAGERLSVRVGQIEVRKEPVLVKVDVVARALVMVLLHPLVRVIGMIDQELPVDVKESANFRRQGLDRPVIDQPMRRRTPGEQGAASEQPEKNPTADGARNGSVHGRTAD